MTINKLSGTVRLSWRCVGLAEGCGGCAVVGIPPTRRLRDWPSRVKYNVPFLPWSLQVLAAMVSRCLPVFGAFLFGSGWSCCWGMLLQWLAGDLSLCQRMADLLRCFMSGFLGRLQPSEAGSTCSLLLFGAVDCRPSTHHTHKCAPGDKLTLTYI
ncbi:hypothetical protein CRENBAI_024560 [Crenichthys baileyi]|uniref:Uncharacterized protein n=1 Tax=Crenichthys baileyi TaxID=28760 RepID=A0AAV9R2J0_9TELE